MPLPHFLIIGENKCGTTSLYHYLCSHPHVLPSLGNGENYDGEYRYKEIRFFDAFFYKGIEWYKQCFPEAKGKISGEASPTYFSKSLCAERIHRMVPQAKLMVILRNPVDRTFSNYLHNMQWVPGFAARYSSFENFLDSMASADAYVLERSLYMKSWAAWEPFYKPEDVLFLTSENLNENPSAAMRQVFRFLGLDDFEINEAQTLRKSRYTETLKPETRASLQSFFEPFNRVFFEMTGVSFERF